MFLFQLKIKIKKQTMNSTKLLWIFVLVFLLSFKCNGLKPSSLCRNSINSDLECKHTNYTYVCANFFCSSDKELCEKFKDLKQIVASIKSTLSYKSILLLLLLLNTINKKFNKPYIFMKDFLKTTMFSYQRLKNATKLFLNGH